MDLWMGFVVQLLAYVRAITTKLPPCWMFSWRQSRGTARRPVCGGIEAGKTPRSPSGWSCIVDQEGLPLCGARACSERLWVEVGTQFARAWRAFFTRLGRLHCLDRKNPSHLWLLHLLFLEEINQDCRDFQDDWNLHPIEGVQTKNQSPADLRFLGQLTEGVYREDPLDGIHPDAINRYYGVHGPRLRRPRNQTGAGNDPEEVEEEDVGAVDVSDEEELENQIGADLQKNIRHEPVKVPRHRSPFKDAELQDLFVQQLEALQLQPDVLPEDYGILEEEWEEEDYPEIEVFRPGTQGKELSIILPRQIWYPRAARWAQALDFMSRILHELEEEDVSDADGDSD
ncbi:hypothetical protein FB45DRAFT_961 [Roridomyces roridus]|uniref:Integrase core domain-containing protein n=1 Tax=Roridomyces roridus TaxID=1738132 RepID=A0AAD7G1E6_9AGAR|nr:hypothetical protein FB45DRAFT_961 [Roridomyces roridus]